jgi:hypothetical protein
VVLRIGATYVCCGSGNDGRKCCGSGNDGRKWCGSGNDGRKCCGSGNDRSGTAFIDGRIQGRRSDRGVPKQSDGSCSTFALSCRSHILPDGDVELRTCTALPSLWVAFLAARVSKFGHRT